MKIKRLLFLTVISLLFLVVLVNARNCHGCVDPNYCAGDEIDADGDGYHHFECISLQCCLVDCDDEDNNVHPGADEVCNGMDDDCDGYTDIEDDNCQTRNEDDCAHGCGADGHGDSIDNDCDSTIDEFCCDTDEICDSGFCTDSTGAGDDCAGSGETANLPEKPCCEGLTQCRSGICQFSCGSSECDPFGSENYCDDGGQDEYGNSCVHIFCASDQLNYAICPQGQSCQGEGSSSGCSNSGNSESCQGDSLCPSGDESDECCASPSVWIDEYTTGYQCCGDDNMMDYGNILSKSGSSDVYCNDKDTYIVETPKWFQANLFQGTILSKNYGSFDNLAYNNKWYSCDADSNIGYGEDNGPGGSIFGNNELLSITLSGKTHEYLCYMTQKISSDTGAYYDYEEIAECCGSDSCFDQRPSLGGAHITNYGQITNKSGGKFCCLNGIFYGFNNINSNQAACECFGGSYNAGTCILGLSQEWCQVASDSSAYLTCNIPGDAANCSSINTVPYHQFAVYNKNCYGDSRKGFQDQLYKRIVWKDIFLAANDKIVISTHAYPAVDSGKWWDCDASNLACQNCDDCSAQVGSTECISKTGADDNFLNCISLQCWTKSGELNVGEYPNQDTNQCCGDDANEYFIKGKDGTSACCNSATKVVINGQCMVDCPLNTVYFNSTEVSEGAQVELIVNSTFNCMGKKILFNLYEYDFPFHDFGAGNDDPTYRGSAIFDQYGSSVQAKLKWTARTDPLESGDSEYYFIAYLDIAHGRNISSPDYTEDLIVHPAVPNPCDPLICQNDDDLCCPSCNIISDNDCLCDNPCNPAEGMACSGDWIPGTDNCCDSLCVPDKCIEIYNKFCTIDEWGSCSNRITSREVRCDESQLERCPLPAKQKPCVEQAFPFFTWFNLIVVSIILLSFYAFQPINGKKYI